MATEFHVALSDKSSEAISRNNIALVYSIVGRYEEAETQLETVRTIVKAISYPLIESTAALTSGFIALCKGDLDSAEHKLRHSLAIAESHSLTNQVAAAYFSLGELQFIERDTTGAFAYFKECEDIATKIHLDQFRINTSAYLLACKSDIGESPDSSSEMQALLKEAESQGNPTVILLTRRLLAYVTWKNRTIAASAESAIENLESALEYARSLPVAYEVQWIGDLIEEIRCS